MMRNPTKASNECRLSPETVGQDTRARRGDNLVLFYLSLLVILGMLWGVWGLGCDGGANNDDWLDSLAFPRRDLISELGEEAYHRKLEEALGENYDTKSKSEGERIYGVDVSFPMHSAWADDILHIEEYPQKSANRTIQPLGDRKTFYKNYMMGCREFYGSKSQSCDQNERDRISMSRNQPKVMQNYTDIGFKKIQAPADVMGLLQKFWRANRQLQVLEKWATGNTYTNHWESPTYMVNVENPYLRGGGEDLKAKIWESARDIVQWWIGESLATSSVYGIRVYQKGAVLIPHVDRLPLVSSAIINVAQDVEEPWPLEVIGHDGVAYNITMNPGDMVSASGSTKKRLL